MNTLHLHWIDTDTLIHKQPPFSCLCLHSCNKKPNVTVPGCTDEEQDLYEGSGYCGILLDKKGPFAVCHPKVNPNVSANTHSDMTKKMHITAFKLKNSFLDVYLFVCLFVFIQDYFRDCLFDLCELDGALSILCEAIEAYVNECQDRGVNIPPWRNQTFCRESIDRGFTLCQVKHTRSEVYPRVIRTLSPFPTQPCFPRRLGPIFKAIFLCGSCIKCQYPIHQINHKNVLYNTGI